MSSFLGPNFSGMRGLILALMLIVCYLTVILIFWWLLGSYCLVLSGYCLLLVVTGRYHSLLLLPTFSMNEHVSVNIKYGEFSP